MSASGSGKARLRLYGDRRGLGSYIVASVCEALGLGEVEFVGSGLCPPSPPCPDERPCLCLPNAAAIAGVEAILEYLLSLNPQQTASVFPLLARGAHKQQSEQERSYWGELERINWVLFEAEAVLRGIDRQRILRLLETLEKELESCSFGYLSGSSTASLSDMLLYSVFRFNRWASSPASAGAPFLPDFPRLSRALTEIHSVFAAAFASAAAAAPPPPPGPLLLSRSCLQASASSAVAAAGEKPQEGRWFYVPTAIAYTNGPPHMGHAYEYLATDTIARFFRFAGKKVFYLTGTDEHGLKIATAAAREGVEPSSFVERYAVQFQALLRQLCNTNDGFVRTATDKHKKVCQWLWNKCKEKGDIYLGSYSGWYNQREEAFVTEREAQATDYKDPVTGKPLEKMQEESYFFKMGRYQQQLIDYIKTHPEFIGPPEKRNEILKRLEEPLQDLSCSRASFTWGVPVPGDEKHVMYVWFDALTNYISGLEPFDEEKSLMPVCWPPTLQMIGKDIIWFHCVIWPCMLLSAGLPLPTRVFAHGFVLGADGEKMSKSLNNCVSPAEVLQRFPADAFRFYVLKEARFGADLRFDMHALAASINNELVNTVGNLLHRLTALTAKFCAGVVPALDPSTPPRQPPFDLTLLGQQCLAAFEETALREGIELPLQAARDLNKFLTDAAPWACPDEKRRQEDIRLCLEALYALAHFLEPYLPEAMECLFGRFNMKPKRLRELSPWFNNLPAGTLIDATGKVLFEPVAAPVVPAAAAAPAASKAAKTKQQQPKLLAQQQQPQQAAQLNGKAGDFIGQRGANKRVCKRWKRRISTIRIRKRRLLAVMLEAAGRPRPGDQRRPESRSLAVTACSLKFLPKSSVLWAGSPVGHLQHRNNNDVSCTPPPATHNHCINIRRANQTSSRTRASEAPMNVAVNETEPPAAADAAAAPNAAAAAAAAAAGNPLTAEDAALFLERAEDVAERVKAILKGDLSLEQLQQEDLREQRDERQRRLQARGRQIAAEERLQQLEEQQRRGKEGLGLPSSDFDWYCVGCRVEYKNDQLQKQQQQQREESHREQREKRCYRCGGSLTDRDSRLAWLQQQLAASKQEKQLVLLRRQKQQQLLRTKAIVTKGPAAAAAGKPSAGPTDYEKWRFYEPETDEEEKQQQQQQLLEQTAPRDTPELQQLEADMRKRQKRRGSQRHRAAALIAEGRAHAAAGSWLLAEEAFAAAVDVKPDSLIALCNLSLAQLKREGWRQAEETTSKLLHICEVFENGYTRSRNLCYKALLRRAFARRQLLLLEQAAADATAAQQLLPNPVEAKALAAEIKTLLQTISQQQEQHQQQQQLLHAAKGTPQPCTASPPAELAAAATAAAATAADAPATAAATVHAAAERRSATAAGAGRASPATERVVSAGPSTRIAEDGTFAVIFTELQGCGCLLHRLPPSTINSLLQYLKASDDARARLCTLQPVASPAAAGPAEAYSAAEADAAAAPLQLQMPRGPARCLLDFALQDIRLSAMSFRRRLRQQQQQQQQHAVKELGSQRIEPEATPKPADAAGAAERSLLSSNVNNVDINKTDTESSSSRERARKSSGGESNSVDCSKALELVLILCSSNTPAALYESLLLPVLQNLLLLLQESRYTVASATLLAELSVHSKARKEMSRAAAADDKTSGALLHWGASAAEEAAAAAGAGASCGKQGCVLALQRTTCLAAAELLQQQTPQQQLLLLEAARRCLCNFSLEAPMRGVLQHKLLQQQQQEGTSPLLQALLPTTKEVEGAAEATAAAAEALSSKLDVLVNLTKASKIRLQICSSKDARRRLALLLHKLTRCCSSTPTNRNSNRSSSTKENTNEHQSDGSQQAETAAAAGRLLVLQLTPEGQQRLLLLNLLLGLLLNLSTDAAAAAGHAAAEANGGAAAASLIRCLCLCDVAAVTAAGTAGAVAAAAANAKVERAPNDQFTTTQLLSRSLSLGARMLQQQPQQEEEMQGPSAMSAAAVMEVEAAAAVVLRCAVERSAWDTAAAAAVRLLSVSAQQQRLLQRAATATTAIAITSQGTTATRQLSTKDLLQLLQPLMRLLIHEGRQHTKAAKTASTADLSETATAATEVFTALGNSLVLLTSLVRMQLSEQPKQQQHQEEEDMLLPLLNAAAETLDFEHQPHIQRNAAICIAAAVHGSAVYRQRLWQQPLISKVLDAARTSKISSR
ncbi:hypothetical protein ACSSS7_003976 [Eimeria intestinalis]